MYIVRRVAAIFPMFILITAITFGLLHLAGDPVEIMMAEREAQFITGETIDNIRRRLGLDQPLHMQYLVWVGNTMRGDLGYSFLSNQPVVNLISNSILNTLRLMLVGECITLFLAINFGVFSAVHRNSKLDTVVSLLSMFGWSMPFFWVGLVAILIFSLYLGWFPSHGSVSIMPVTATQLDMLADQLWHLALPAAVLSVSNLAYLFRLVKTSMLGVLDKAYVTTARSKGLPERVVIYKHALRNALLPVITVIGLDIGRMFAGAAVLEIVFSYPGMGNLLVTSALVRDFPTVLGTTTVIGVMVLVGNMISDVGYALADPRVRY